jgi:hypothetical protein
VLRFTQRQALLRSLSVLQLLLLLSLGLLQLVLLQSRSFWLVAVAAALVTAALIAVVAVVAVQLIIRF